jgi:DNA repair protein RadC
MLIIKKKVSEASSYHSKIMDWPVAERPREKLMNRGSRALSDAELLAILLRSGTGNITAVDLAKTILREYRTLGHLATRSVQDLRQFKGLGEAKAIALVAVFEISRRTAAHQQGEKVRIQSPHDIVRIYQPLLRDMQQEVFKVVLLDNANHLLRDVDISIGILNCSLVHPREVFRVAIAEPAAGIILIHNHPSGNPEPSSEDVQITRQLVDAGKIIGIPVHDHIILAGHLYTSFVEKGLI